MMSHNFQDPIDHPHKYSYLLAWGLYRANFRPLKANDVDLLGSFLSDLSPNTRRYYSLNSYDRDMAAELCDAINTYDKLRFVIEAGGKIVGLVNFSFDLVKEDHDRYQSYGMPLDDQTDCRMGICFADAFQGIGMGSQLIPVLPKVVQAFGQKRIILLGGVVSENKKAIRFYEKMGFELKGEFKNEEKTIICDMILTM